MGITKLFTDFFNSERTGGLLLIVCTFISILISNSGAQDGYIGFWETQFNGHSLTHWVNDGLMCIFFLLIGLELEREVYQGELSNLKDALFPIFAAIGGVLIPAGIYLLLNHGTPAQSGAGIPMATDIAFAIGMLSLLGNRVPTSLKVFLTALAVIDDLIAIFVIAIFYTSKISFVYLGAALGIFLLLLLLNRLKVKKLIPYLLGGIIMWYCMLHSGIHATIAGVLLAFAIPFGDGSIRSPSHILQNLLHIPVAFFIIPVFALANTCIIFNNDWASDLLSSTGIGIYTGLVLGKPLGILLFSGLAVLMGICSLPGGLKWKHILGAGLLAGIGFTMSIFITMLAFKDAGAISTAKISIIFASVSASLLGLGVLFLILKNKSVTNNSS